MTDRSSRTATIRSRLPEATLVAAAIAPDNTDEMATRVDPDDDGTATLVTTIERETTGGLHATVDDYLVNLDVATTVAQHGRTTANDGSPCGDSTTTHNHE